LIAKWGSNPPATFDIGRVFRPELAANLLAVYPDLVLTGAWSNAPEVQRRQLDHYDETFATHLVLTRFFLRLGVNARRFHLRVTEDADATTTPAGS
jgi:hypothetical protein